MSPTPEPAAGCYAVIFRSVLRPDHSGYAETASQMEAIAAQQPGYLAFHSVREGAHGITISYWESEADIRRFKAHTDHLWAQREGRRRWYRSYTVEVCEISRQYQFTREEADP